MSRGLDLGDVTFGLVADTNGLDRALGKLRVFGDLVNKTAKSTDEGAAQTTNAFIRQEKAIHSAYQKVLDLNVAIRQSGAPTSMITANTNTFKSLTTALTSGELSALKYARAQEQITARLNNSKRALQEFQDTQARSVSIENAISRAQLKVGSTVGAYARTGAPVEFGNAQQTALSTYTTSIQGSKGNPAAMAAAQRTFNTALQETDQKYKAWIADMKQVESLQTQINALGRASIRSGIGGGATAQLQSHLTAYKAALSGGNLGGAQTALGALKTNMADLENKIASTTGTAGKFAFIMRDLERATVLTMGPLSGFGARMAVLASLFETTSIKSALLVAGLAGTTAAFALLATESVKATMKSQQWNAMMITASGASVLVADDIKYVIDQSKKYGQNIEATIPAFAKFATASRLMGLSITEQKKIFESFVVAGAALHWTAEQTGNAFLALEQIMSKGTVQTEEIKKQLGNVLPGSFELAAAAVGKTTQEFAKMLEQGEVLSKDFVPKFATLIRTVYEGAAVQGSQSLQAQLNNVHSSALELGKAFDDVTQLTGRLASWMKDLSNVMDWTSANMDKVVTSTLVLAGAIAGLVAPSMVGGMVALGTAIGALITRMASLGTIATIITLPVGGVVAVLARLGLALAGGYTAFQLFNDASDMAVASADKYSGELGKSVEELKKYGMVSKQVKERLLEQAAAQLKVLDAELATREAHLRSLPAEPKVSESAITTGGYRPGMLDIETQDDTPKETARDKANKGIEALQAQRDKIKKSLEELNKLKLAPDILGATDTKGLNGLKTLEDQTRKVFHSIEELRTAQEALKSGAKTDDSKILHADALRKAKDFLENIDSVSNKGALAKMLRDAGFEGKTLLEQYTKLYEEQGKLIAGKDRLIKQADAEASAQSKINEETDKFAALVFTGDKARAESAKRVSTMSEQLAKAGVEQAKINSLTAAYADILEKIDKQEEDNRKAEKLKAANEAIDKHLGKHKASIDAVNKKYDDMIALIREAGGVTEDTVKKIEAIENMRIKALWGAAFSLDPALKTVHETLKTIGDDGAKALTSIFTKPRDATVSFWVQARENAKSYFRTVLEMLAETITQLMIVKPLMESLFGGLYDGKTAGTGSLGGYLLKGLSYLGIDSLNSAPVTTSVPVPVTAPVTVLYAHSGGIIGQNTFASRNVPSSLFNNAPRYHNGLAPDEFPAILQRGEAVLTKEQQQQRRGGQSNFFQIDVNVQAQKGASEQDGQNIGRGISKELEAFMNSWAIKNKRPGGIFA